MLVRGVECETPAFKLCPGIVEELDPVEAHSQIPPNILLICDIRSLYHFLIKELGTFELNQEYEAFCVDGNLKPKHKHLEAKGVIHILHTPRDFQGKWIRLILSHAHDMKLWLDQPT